MTVQVVFITIKKNTGRTIFNKIIINKIIYSHINAIKCIRRKKIIIYSVIYIIYTLMNFLI